MANLNKFQIAERKADLNHLHEEGQWKNGVPEWVYEVLREYYPGLSLAQIGGIDAIEKVALREMVDSLLRIVGELSPVFQGCQGCGGYGCRACEEHQGNTAVDEAEYKYGEDR